MPRKAKPIRCCAACGRDTVAMYCNRCSGHNSKEDQIGRSMLRPGGTDPFDECEDEQKTTAAEYHGETLRDDI